MESFESQWAIALKKTKLTSKIPLNTKQENILDQIKYNKARLRDALKSKNENQSWAIYKKLIKLRVNLFVFQIQQIKKNDMAVTQEVVKKYFDAFIKESEKLAGAIKNSLR